MTTPVANPRESIIAAGETAPDFTLKDQNRKEWTLSDHVKQGDVVLCFFPLAFTGTCSTEMKCVNDEIDQWQKRGAQVIGISCDSPAALRAWAEQLGLKQTLLADMHRVVCRAFGLYWKEHNVSSRGTVIIGKSADGAGKVKWAQSRDPGKAMNWDDVLTRLAT